MNINNVKKVIDEYITLENPSEVFSQKDILEFFSSIPIQYLDEDKAEFHKLPEYITVYRGSSFQKYNPNILNVSWSTNKKLASWFATRFRAIQKSWMLKKGEIRKEDVLFYINARGENEIILNPSDLCWEEEIIATHDDDCIRNSCKCTFDEDFYNQECITASRQRSLISQLPARTLENKSRRLL
ncbi:MAG: hypothetical protein CBB96_00850 [Gammaproteobacteria bacterium TMED36]|nr:MAG: hypothetical protein CBB96_00850 [Gammaproteobacteria bacterium TMED36]|tara:strand:+ start:3072 stop:3626 length:555 start_codon:yes stop_codon:yes gene_type:complete